MQLSRWHGVDGKAEKYISQSTYHYAGNNPIRNFDIDGNEFDEANEKKAAKIEKRIDRKIKNLQKKVAKLEKREKDATDFIQRIIELKHSKQDINDMRNDDKTEYRYEKFGNKKSKLLGLEGPASVESGKNEEGKNVVTMFTARNMNSKIHETRHGGQNARNEFNIITGENYGVKDEISAYRAQYGWKGSISYYSFTNFDPSTIEGVKNYLLLEGGIELFKKRINNINNINANFVNSLVDNPGINQTLVYPPKDEQTQKLIIPMDTWNSN